MTEAFRAKRTSICMLFDVRDGNPNGDPANGNVPRTDSYSQQGLATGPCLKRKVRDTWALMGHDLFIARGAVLENKKRDVLGEGGKKKGKGKDDKAANMAIMRDRYIDVRLFGGVLAGEYALDSIRGPIQFGVSRSIDPVNVTNHLISRCAAQKENEKDANQTFGEFSTIDYALYRVTIKLNPFYAAQSGLREQDLIEFKAILRNLFANDAAAGRASMVVRGIYAFEDENDLGSAQDDILLEKIKVARRPGIEKALSFEDYEIILPSADEIPSTVKLSNWL